MSTNAQIDDAVSKIKVQISSVVSPDLREIVSSLLTNLVSLSYNQGHIDGVKSALDIISNADVHIRPVTLDYSHLKLVSED
jgi:hypothetical protein